MVRGKAWLTLMLVGLVGCGPTVQPSGGPSSSPAPTHVCTPEAGGSARPCTDSEYDGMVAREAEYERAESVYRTYLVEYVKAMRAGGARELSPALTQVLGDPELAKNTLAQLRQFKADGLRVVGTDPTIATVTRKPGQTMHGSSTAIQFCVDARSLTVYRGKTRMNKLGVSRETMFFRADSPSELRIVAGTFEVVKSCTS